MLTSINEKMKKYIKVKNNYKEKKIIFRKQNKIPFLTKNFTQNLKKNTLVPRLKISAAN